MERLDAAQNPTPTCCRVARPSPELETARSALDNALADLADDERIATLARSSAADGLPTDLLALYDKLRADNGGSALPPCTVADARLPDRAHPRRSRSHPGAPETEVIRCEECRRIVVRTPESGL